MPKLSGNYYILIENSENSTNNSVDDVCATNKTTVLVYILSLCKKVHNVIVSPVVSVSLWCIKKVIIISQFLRHVSRSREIQGEKKGKPSTSKELEEEAAENVIQNKESVSEIAVEPGKSYSEEENESSSDEFTQLDVEDLSRPDDTTDDIEIISPVVVELASNKKAVENILAEEAKDLSENLVPKQLENKLSDSKIFVNDDFKYFGDNEQNNLKPMNFLSKQEQGASPSTEDIIKNTLNKSSSGKSIIEHFQQSKAHTQPPLNDDSSQTTNVKEINKLSKEITEQVVTKAVSLVEENMGMKSQVRVLTLNDKEHQDSVLYRLEKNWTLQFRLGPSLLGRKILLYCNYPEEGAEFKRNSYQLLPWSEDEGCEHSDDTALQIQIQVKKAGSYHYYFTYEDIESSTPQGSGFFIVDPILTYGDNEILPLDCIQCQTVLAKSLGPFSTWENKLKVAKESGYNIIHFTPIQALGDSNSSYSLKAQLQLNPIFDNNKKTTFKDIETFTSKLRKEWKMLSICDIVLNHTANETKWLEEHPETTYNCSNCPYLRPAYLLDAALHQFTLDVQKGLYENRGIPTEIYSEDHLNAVRHALYTNVLPQINLQDLYICNVNKLVAEFLDYARNKVPPISETRNPVEELKLVQDPLYRRLESTVSMDTALRIYNVFRQDCFDEDCRLKKCGEELKNKLDQLNAAVIGELNDHISAAIENTIAGMRYFRVQSDGPKIRDVSEKNPLAFRYFTDFGKPASIKEHEEIMYGTNSKYLMAHNGWVMDSDPLRNFAAPDSNVYIRRELIAWGDSVKLRYGEKPEDCPFLWNHMKEYVELTAKIFDGVRLDNCHSTPIPIAEYLLDCARKVRPNLYVVAELFTNSDQKDNIFVNRLGISSLIREAMSAWDSHEEGRLVYRYGGYPVGAFIQPHIRPLVPAIAHALFLDLTHDNPSPVEKRSVFDLLPSTALVNMACCASGSNRGYDELVPHHVSYSLYHCDQEEKDEGNGFGVYDIPGFGPMVYCGFQGLISLLSKIRPFNDLGHPMCGNLRAGNWMIDYVWQRLKFGEGTNELGVWIQENIKPLKDIPRYLIPCYFDAFVTGLYMLLLDQSFTLMSNFITYGSTFVKGLALGSVQCVSYCKSANLPPFSPNLSPPLPPKIRTNEGKEVQACTTLAAGLPHFSTGYMRSWGRDTFIALRGLLLLTGRHEEARFHILGYAACLRHGLIPNLLDSGNPRYNCRDAVWWWLHCIKSYVEEVSNGVEILSDTVSRLFPTDSSARQEPGVADQPLHVVMQEALKVHFQGLVFRERNAGRQIDAHMSDRGFNNQIGVHPETGFVFGGNESNCGTWMDKMGSSDKAGNRGKPATPRDGSAVELVGLSKSVVTWLDKLYHAKKYPYDGVERIHKNGNVTKWTFRQWADKIQTNFEKYFWVNMSPVAGENRPDLINKRGIYKDSHGASQEYADFQLRCNFPITMVVAPELFDSKRAWTALQKVEKYLLGPLGLKTLDPEDWSYNGIYDNSNDSEDYNTAHGFNYHQGPEWVWPMGFYLRAKLHFAAENGDLRRTIANTKVVLSRHFTELQTSVWRGLSELTNANGTFCHGSCATQAWSMACILEVLHDLQKIESKQPIILN
ncbi:glycogen debranching enzyme-like [Agrilus planipennis]|uniref:Glycogen debranching enzyme n=1 Tax=Agrilus planipennis TaxID=224129 RepID=A0A7F5REW1_AGRPL|nr:glycogen debranching enzyme-like [Agrilus planipennis]